MASNTVAQATTKQTARKFVVTLTVAQDDMLNKLAGLTGRSKAYLIREALNQLLGAYRELLIKRDTDGK